MYIVWGDFGVGVSSLRHLGPLAHVDSTQAPKAPRRAASSPRAPITHAPGAGEVAVACGKGVGVGKCMGLGVSRFVSPPPAASVARRRPRPIIHRAIKPPTPPRVPQVRSLTSGPCDLAALAHGARRSVGLALPWYQARRRSDSRAPHLRAAAAPAAVAAARPWG